MAVIDNRPFFLNLIKIKLPVPGIVSILHRISGLLMFIALPFMVYLLDLSLQGDAGFAEAADYFVHPLVKIPGLVILWSVIHHLFAGIRFLLIDIDIGVDKQPAKCFAWLVLIAETIVFLWLALEMML